MIEIKFKKSDLEKLKEALANSKNLSVSVGVLGDTPREGEKITNAEIGKLHEFGIGVDERSFLRMPLMTQLNKRLEEAGAYTPKTIERIVKEGDFKSFYDNVATIAEQVVMDAFETEGFGKWTKSIMKYKKTKLTLTEDGQLRKSITSRVDDV